MEILLDKGQNPSLAYSLNYVAKDGKTYIIDNHLAAFWCMAQLDFSSKYNFLHIDRHYDLSKCDENLHSDILQVNFTGIPVDKITSFVKVVDKHTYPLITWNNYINVFNKRYPDMIKNAVFVTHDIDDFYYEKKYTKCKIHDLFRKNLNTKRKWIFNIDLDFFFKESDDESITQACDREFIKKFGCWLREQSNNAALIIICLSPECCGGWKNSVKVLEMLRAQQ